MYEEIARNKRNSVILVAVFALLVIVLGYIFGYVAGYGLFGLVIAVVIALISALSGYYHGDKMVLAVSKAKEADREQHKQLYNIVEEMCIASGMPMPKVYVIHDDDAPNAFATGRDPQHASIAVTTALMNRLNRSELQGVIAHELSHIQDYDIRFMTLIGVLVGTVAMMSDFFLRSLWWGGARGRRRSRSSQGGGAEAILLLVAIALAIIAPFFAVIIQMACSREREYLADASAAKMTRYPEGLASALENISSNPGKLEVSNRATQHLYIVNPIQQLKSKEKTSLFSTHPPITERIKRLREL